MVDISHRFHLMHFPTLLFIPFLSDGKCCLRFLFSKRAKDREEKNTSQNAILYLRFFIFSNSFSVQSASILYMAFLVRKIERWFADKWAHLSTRFDLNKHQNYRVAFVCVYVNQLCSGDILKSTLTSHKTFKVSLTCTITPPADVRVGQF